jgi:hypothetical protein
MKPAALQLLVLSIVLAGLAAPAEAQDDSRYALLTSFPNPTVSFQYEVNDRFAFRVETSYTYRDEESEGPTSSVGLGVIGLPFETTSRHVRSAAQTHTGSIGVAGIITLHRAEQFRLYLAPRIALGFTRQSVTSTETITQTLTGRPTASNPTGTTTTTSVGEPETVDNSSTSPSLGASIGASVDVHRRLALFGEAGFTYARRNRASLLPTLSPLPTDYDYEVTSVNTRAVGGLMFRF